MVEIGTLRMAQQDGGAPTTLAAGSAPGESGVSVLGVRFGGGMHLLTTPRWHCICFQLAPGRVEKRMAGRVACYERPVGSLSITPSGCDIGADADEDVEILVVAIDPGRMALAAAECALPDARLIERMYGDDPALFALACTLAYESIHNYPNGAFSWNEAASSFVDGLVAGHTEAMPARPRGTLGKDKLRRLRDYVVAHLDEPIWQLVTPIRSLPHSTPHRPVAGQSRPARSIPRTGNQIAWWSAPHWSIKSTTI